MARTRLDGVIEAVHYSSDGKIALVRAYERRGAAWSDHVLLNRKELIERLKQGKHFLTGRRKAYLGGTFETGKAVRFAQGVILTEGQAAGQDILPGVPIF